MKYSPGRRLLGRESGELQLLAMFEWIHQIGSTIRHLPFLNEQRWFWQTIERGWQRSFRRFSSQHGFKAHLNDDVFRLVYEYGSRYDRHDQRAYEPVVYRALIREIKEGMTVCDIGAHVGLLTLAAAKRVGPTGHVYAFEPAPEAFAYLQRHIAFNEYQDRAEAIRSVVSDTAGVVTFYVYQDSMSASLGRDNLDVLSPQRLSDPFFKAVEVKVPSVTLDQFCEKRKVLPDILKIDVEGAELLVLRGARELLERKRVVVLCEIHPLQMENCRSSFSEFEDYLDNLDYTIEVLDEPNPQGIFHSRITRRP